MIDKKIRLLTFQPKDIVEHIYEKGVYTPEVYKERGEVYNGLVERFNEVKGRTNGGIIFTWERIDFEDIKDLNKDLIDAANDKYDCNDRVALLLEVPEEEIYRTSFYDYASMLCFEWDGTDYVNASDYSDYEIDKERWNIDKVETIQTIIDRIERDWIIDMKEQI